MPTSHARVWRKNQLYVTNWEQKPWYAETGLTTSSLGEQSWICSFTNCCGVSTPAMADFKPPLWLPWMWSWEKIQNMHTIGSCRLIWAGCGILLGGNFNNPRENTVDWRYKWVFYHLPGWRIPPGSGDKTVGQRKKPLLHTSFYCAYCLKDPFITQFTSSASESPSLISQSLPLSLPVNRTIMKTIKVCCVWERDRNGVGLSLSHNVVFFRHLREKDHTRILGLALPALPGDFRKAYLPFLMFSIMKWMQSYSDSHYFYTSTLSCCLPSRYMVRSTSWPCDRSCQ